MLIVALILSILVAAIIGVFVSVVRVQRYTLATQLLLDQTSYSMEYMSRALRMAKKNTEGECAFNINDNYHKEDSSLWFVNYNKQCQLFKKEDSGFKSYNSDEYPLGLPLFSSDFKVNNFSINLMGESESDFLQPRVTIS